MKNSKTSCLLCESLVQVAFAIFYYFRYNFSIAAEVALLQLLQLLFVYLWMSLTLCIISIASLSDKAFFLFLLNKNYLRLCDRTVSFLRSPSYHSMLTPTHPDCPVFPNAALRVSCCFWRRLQFLANVRHFVYRHSACSAAEQEVSLLFFPHFLPLA